MVVDKKKEYNGECLCGAVSYQIKGPYIRFNLCHCSRCRKGSGSAFAANVFTRAKNLEFTKGADKVKRFDLPESETYSRCFCENCGSTVPQISRDGRLAVIPMGSIADFNSRETDQVVYWDNRADWYEQSITAEHKVEADFQ